MRKPIEVIRKPRKCPRCGGNVYRILYGEPMYSEEEYFEHFGEHVVFGGCCVTDNDSDWACQECYQEYMKLSFPRNSKVIAREALLNDESKIYCDVEYVGLYKKMMAYRAVVKKEYICDGFHLVFVKEDGTTKNMIGVEILDVIEKTKKTR